MRNGGNLFLCESAACEPNRVTEEQPPDVHCDAGRDLPKSARFEVLHRQVRGLLIDLRG